MSVSCLLFDIRRESVSFRAYFYFSYVANSFILRTNRRFVSYVEHATYAQKKKTSQKKKSNPANHPAYGPSRAHIVRAAYHPHRPSAHKCANTSFFFEKNTPYGPKRAKKIPPMSQKSENSCRKCRNSAQFCHKLCDSATKLWAMHRSKCLDFGIIITKNSTFQRNIARNSAKNTGNRCYLSLFGAFSADFH